MKIINYSKPVGNKRWTYQLIADNWNKTQENELKHILRKIVRKILSKYNVRLKNTSLCLKIKKIINIIKTIKTIKIKKSIKKKRKNSLGY